MDTFRIIISFVAFILSIIALIAAMKTDNTNDKIDLWAIALLLFLSIITK